jgi:rhodanese-related sulfurtransferase
MNPMSDEPRPRSTITAAELEARLGRDDITVIDSRPLAAFNGWRLQGESRGGHIPGAIAIPGSWLPRLSDTDFAVLVAAHDLHPGSAVVVYDVPLLVEARVDDPWDNIVVAHAPAEVRRRRLVELRGMEEPAAQARIEAQVSDEKRLAIADVVIDTAGTLADTIAQTDVLWERIRPQ